MKVIVYVLILELIFVLIFGTIDHKKIITFGSPSTFIAKRKLVFQLKWNGLYNKFEFLLI